MKYQKLMASDYKDKEIIHKKLNLQEISYFEGISTTYFNIFFSNQRDSEEVGLKGLFTFIIDLLFDIK